LESWGEYCFRIPGREKNKSKKAAFGVISDISRKGKISIGGGRAVVFGPCI
jgi:hypothetical protein